MRGTHLRRTAGILILGIALLFPHLAAAQQGLVTSSLTVTGYGQASAPADNATVHLTVSSESMMMAPVPTSDLSAEQEVVPVVTALARAGVDESTIDVITGPSTTAAASFYGPAIAIIRFELADPTSDSISSAVDAATAAASDARLFIGGVNVHLASDDCATLEHDAREIAVADARDRADVMGELAGLLPGEVIAVRDVPLGPESAYVYQDPLAAGCTPVEISGMGWTMFGPGVYDPTQEPVVTVYAQVEMTFATSPSILATPSG